MGESALKFIPLGGVGTFGMNCAVLEWGQEFVVVDAGIKIPQGNFPGVDLFLPDFTYILENLDRLKGIIVTHGHDDHIGALPFLLDKVDVPVYGTAFSLALVRERLESYIVSGNKPDLRQILFGVPVKVGEASIEAVPVDHSIPDSASLIFRTPAGLMVHTGDFRIPGGIPGPALEPLRAAGREGVDLLVCDSTNADKPGVAPSESEVAGTLHELFRQAPGRVFLATFASHIMRISAAMEAAGASGRKVILEGKRIVRNFEIAAKLGYLQLPEGVLSSPETLDPEEENMAVYVLTGSQGEPFSALSRIARGEHSGIGVRQGDTVVFSSRMIPGNELAVGLMIDTLFRTGATVFYQDPPRVHVSGHGYAGEIVSMIDLTAPCHFVPVHGDFRNLVACAGLAEASGMKAESIHILDAGEVLQISGKEANRPGGVPSGRMLVDGGMMIGLADPVLGQRRRMAREGVVVVAFSLPVPGGDLPEPVVHSLGVGVGSQGEEVDLEAGAEIRRVLEQDGTDKKSEEDLKELLRLAVRKIYRKVLDKRPTVLTVVLKP